MNRAWEFLYWSTVKQIIRSENSLILVAIRKIKAYEENKLLQSLKQCKVLEREKKGGRGYLCSKIFNATSLSNL